MNKNKLPAKHSGKSHAFFSKIFSDVSVQDKINFARHLSIVIKAGLPILEGLKIIKKQTESKTLSSIIEQIVEDVSSGQFLATSLGRFPDIFSEFFVNIVRVGETSGTLSANFAYLADELKKSQDLANKVKSAMVYPLIIMIATASLTSFLVFFAFPKILPIFSTLHVNLPLSTRILIATSKFLINDWLYVVGGLAALFAVWKALFSFNAVKFFRDRFLFFIPVLSRLIIDINMANFTRILSVLLRGGIRIVEAVTITSQTFDNLVYRRELLSAAEEIRKGEPLASYLTRRKKFFPSLLSGLIEIGENTGNLQDNLIYLADYYKDEAELGLHDLTTLIEPLLLLTMGLLVGFVAISIITPIYQITQGVGTR